LNGVVGLLLNKEFDFEIIKYSVNLNIGLLNKKDFCKYLKTYENSNADK